MRAAACKIPEDHGSRICRPVVARSSRDPVELPLGHCRRLAGAVQLKIKPSARGVSPTLAIDGSPSCCSKRGDYASDASQLHSNQRGPNTLARGVSTLARAVSLLHFNWTSTGHQNYTSTGPQIYLNSTTDPPHPLREIHTLWRHPRRSLRRSASGRVVWSLV